MGMANADAHGRPEPIYLGWRHLLPVPDPGPPPKRPTPDEYLHLSEEWLAEQRRAEAEINRPLLLFAAAIAAIALLLLVLTLARLLPWLFTFVGLLACLLALLPLLVGLWQGRQVTRARIAEEERRLAERRTEAERTLRERQEEHARHYSEWLTRRRAFEAQPRWYAVTVPPDTGRIDVLGGTDTGWSALATTVATGCLRAGGDLTVVDLSGRAVAGDLVALARDCGAPTRVWVLPADAPRLELGTNLGADALTDILTVVAAAREPARDPAADAGLLARVLGVLGPEPRIEEITAALRVLATDEAEAAALSGPLSPRQRAELREQAGTAPETRERAWGLERHLAALDGMATRTTGSAYAQVKVIATDRGSGADSGRMFGTYILAALRHLLLRLGSRPAAEHAWRHTVLVCGADLVSREERAELAAAAEHAGVALLLLHRRPDAQEFTAPRRSPLAVMHAEDAETARLLTGVLGGEKDRPCTTHRLTEVIGAALSGTAPGTYGTGRSRDPGDRRRTVAPLDLVRRLSEATAWGRATHQAAQMDGPDDAEGGPCLRIDEAGLRELPHTALLIPGAEPAAEAGEEPVAADCNPGILTLPTATLATAPPPARRGSSAEAAANLGPPRERLDWRRTP